MANTCTVTIVAVDSGGNPVANTVITAQPILNNAALHLSLASVWTAIAPPAIASSATNGSGVCTIDLPWPSVCDPSTASWQLGFPDGSTLTGAVPEGVASATDYQLDVTYGWTLSASG